MYSSYLPYVTARLAIPCDFIVELYGTHTGSQYDMLVKAYKVAPYSGPNPVLQLVVTESDIQYSWQGQTELNFVCRQMIPDQNGTVLDFSTSDTVSLNLSFTMGGWPLAHTEFVAFLQNNTTKEALQGIKVPAAFLPPPPQPPATEFEAVSTENCSGYEVQYTDMSSGDPTVWAWTFPGGTPETSTEQNPVIEYALPGDYDVKLIVNNAFGTDTLLKTEYIHVDLAIGIECNKAPDFTLYPNPANDKLFISCKEKLQSVEIMNIAGVVVKIQKCNASKAEINISDLPSGMYFIRLQTKNKLITNKIIKLY
jgi:hypothetical protein